MADVIELRSLSKWASKSTGNWSCIIENPTECQDFKHLTQREARINGHLYFIVAVEHFAHAPPYRAGEKIGLVVRPRGFDK